LSAPKSSPTPGRHTTRRPERERFPRITRCGLQALS
jgi:hypothetical protein